MSRVLQHSFKEGHSTLGIPHDTYTLPYVKGLVPHDQCHCPGGARDIIDLHNTVNRLHLHWTAVCCNHGILSNLVLGCSSEDWRQERTELLSHCLKLAGYSDWTEGSSLCRCWQAFEIALQLNEQLALPGNPISRCC
jgi:hypothetical protein